MSTGMLWFDNSNMPLEDKIKKARAYYEKKYGGRANECLVHPSLLKDGTPEIEGMTIKPYRPVLPGYIWLGMKEQQT